MNLNTGTVVVSSIPPFFETLWKHYTSTKRKKAHASRQQLFYDEGIELIRHFLCFASKHRIEELQKFTGGYIPAPSWVYRSIVDIPDQCLTDAAHCLIEHFGEQGIKAIGGVNWWQFRTSILRAEWIEMKSYRRSQKRLKDPNDRVLFYVHGGAYFFNAVDTERYQIQRHARKLRARAFSPRYRLAPQFPFPCALLDVLSCYLYLLKEEKVDPKDIIVCGDSAGGGLCLALLCILRDKGLPLPSCAVLISPWVDLTHSFPSICEDASGDYLPAHGFHFKPSLAWPPPTDADLEEFQKGNQQSLSEGVHVKEAKDYRLTGTVREYPSVVIDGKKVTIKDQIQMYCSNQLLNHPLVSPVMQPTLGGLCPLLIIAGSVELLRDEITYFAHKAANPSEFSPEHKDVYPPTNVKFQIFDDCSHVTTTLPFCRPAKHMYRSVAKFGLGFADLEYVDHMIRERVDLHGRPRPMEDAKEIPCLQMDKDSIGIIKPGPVSQWLKEKLIRDNKYKSRIERIKTIRIKRYLDSENGYLDGTLVDEDPPPSSLVRNPTIKLANEAASHWRKTMKPSVAATVWGKIMSKEDKRREERLEDSTNDTMSPISPN